MLAGTFAFSTKLAVLTIPGVVLSAAYMLRLLQRMIWGGQNNSDPSHLSDLNTREVMTLVPLVAFVFWIGLAPTLFLNVFRVSVSHLLAQFHAGVAL